MGLTDSRALDVAFRTGYSRSHSAAMNLSFDPAFPEHDMHVASVGLGFLCHAGGKFLGLISCGSPEKQFLSPSSIGMDFSYQAFLVDARTVVGNSNPTVDGTYRSTNHSGGVTVRINF